MFRAGYLLHSPRAAAKKCGQPASKEESKARALLESKISLFKKHLNFSNYNPKVLKKLKLQQGVSFNLLQALICYSAEGAEANPEYAQYIVLCIYSNALEILNKTVDLVSKDFSLEECLAAAIILMMKCTFDTVFQPNGLFAEYLDLDLNRLNELESILASKMDYTFPANFSTESNNVSSFSRDNSTPWLVIKTEKPTEGEYKSYERTTYCLVKKNKRSRWQLFRYESGHEVEADIMGANDLFACLYDGDELAEIDTSEADYVKLGKNTKKVQNVRAIIHSYHAESMGDRARFFAIQNIVKEKAQTFFTPKRQDDNNEVKSKRIMPSVIAVIDLYQKSLFWYLPTAQIRRKKAILDEITKILNNQSILQKDKLSQIHEVLQKNKTDLEKEAVFIPNYNLVWAILFAVLLVTMPVVLFKLNIGFYFLHFFITGSLALYYFHHHQECQGKVLSDKLMQLTSPLDVKKLMPDFQESKADYKGDQSPASSRSSGSLSPSTSGRSLDTSASTGSLSARLPLS